MPTAFDYAVANASPFDVRNANAAAPQVLDANAARLPPIRTAPYTGLSSFPCGDFSVPAREGRYLFTNTLANPKTGVDIWVLPLFGDRKPFPYVQTEFQDIRPRLSPDGRRLAYQSNESRRIEEAYVVSFPQPGAKWQISNGGGSFPTWSRDGRELYYYSRDQSKVMAVDIRPGALFQFGVPKALFEVRISTNATSFEVSKDGRFLLPALMDQNATTPMTVVLNWPEVLKNR